MDFAGKRAIFSIATAPVFVSDQRRWPPMFEASQEQVMRTPTLQINNRQLVDALSQFPPDRLKKVIDQLFRKNLYSPPSLTEITRAASRTVKRQKLGPEAAAEAVQWARSQK